MSEHDLDSLYKRASAQDVARPSAAVRQTILEHARRLAAEPGRLERAAPSRSSRWLARWTQLRWQIAVPLATAALAVILWQPLLRSMLPAPARLRQSAPPAAAASRSAGAPPAAVVSNIPRPMNLPQAAPEPFPAAPAAAPAPPASEASPANLASNADVAASSAASAARRQTAPSAAPLAELRERAASALSPSVPLHEAAAQGDIARVHALLQQSAAPIDTRDARGRTALMLAVLHGHEAVVRALLQQGANPNIGDATGRTPLAVARQRHQLAVIEALLQAGAR